MSHHPIHNLKAVQFCKGLSVVQGISVDIAKVRKARHTNINDLDRLQMLTMYLSGLPVDQISYKMCVSIVTVYIHLKKARDAGFLTVQHKPNSKYKVKPKINPLVIKEEVKEEVKEELKVAHTTA